MHGSVQFMQIITRYFQRADARSAWSKPAENVGRLPAQRSRSGSKHRADQGSAPGVGVRSAEPGGSDRARVPAASVPVTKITSVYRSHFPHRFFQRLNISTVVLRGDISMALLFSCDTSFFIWIFPFARTFILSPRFFLCRAIFPAKLRSRYRAWTWALVVFGSSREERVKG